MSPHSSWFVPVSYEDGDGCDDEGGTNIGSGSGDGRSPKADSRFRRCRFESRRGYHFHISDGPHITIQEG